jgi:hypothetical protein
MVRRTYLAPDHAFTERPSLLSCSGRLVSRRRHRREYSATTDYVLIHGAWQTLDTLRRPEVDMHNRMKEALVLLGKLPRAVVRPPLVKMSDAEIARIRDALIEAGLLDTRTAQGRNAA